ncbi:MAG TPA: helix-turn-helix domain-containing protein [Sphingomicrobium sp.]|nr:helix-turn-helix domain-containing protein [Sphingomicrobium sp.]
MKKSDFESLRRGLAQARAHIAGEAPARVTLHHPVDVRAIRDRLDMTREQFALTFGLEARTIEQWEQGRRHPDRSTETYLRLINQYADTLAKLVADLEPINDNPDPAPMKEPALVG